VVGDGAQSGKDGWSAWLRGARGDRYRAVASRGDTGPGYSSPTCRRIETESE